MSDESVMPSEEQKGMAIAVIDATYVSTVEGGPAKHIGLWYQAGDKFQLLLFPLDRTDILCAENGDKATLVRVGETWDLRLQGN